MPAVAAPAKVLVTGANGYIASWVVREFLSRGYTVRGTVRSESKTYSLQKVFKDELENGKLAFVIVSDITQPGAFDEVVKGVDAIAHMASPFTFKADDPEELIRPAVRGTVGILESALKHAGPQLKRVILLSSAAAVVDMKIGGRMTEDNWNESSVNAVKEDGRAASNLNKYFASKTLSERAAWDFVSKNAGLLSWDLVSLCPTFVFGPVLNEFSSPAELGESMGQFYQTMLTKSEVTDSDEGLVLAWVDVRDVALSHAKALQVPEAGGQRFLLCVGECIWQDLLDVACELGFADIKKGTPGAGVNMRFSFTHDGSKARKVLGINYRNAHTMVKDSIEDLRARGWLNQYKI